MQFEELGDVQALDKLGADLAVVEVPLSDASETAEQQRTLDQNDGIAFPYDPVLAQSVGQILGIGSGVAAKKYGAHWELNPDESQQLSVALCQVVERYFPDMQPTSPLTNLAFVSATVLGPRVLLNVMGGGQSESAN